MAELRITELLKERGMTQKTLAKRMGIGPIALSKMLSRGKPNFENLEALAAALGCEVPDLFSRSKTTIICPHCRKTITIKTE